MDRLKDAFEQEISSSPAISPISKIAPVGRTSRARVIEVVAQFYYTHLLVPS